MADKIKINKKVASENKKAIKKKTNIKNDIVKSDHATTEKFDINKMEGEVVLETTHQCYTAVPLIYNARFEDTVLIVENLGMGDVYVQEYLDSNAESTREHSHRLLYAEQLASRARKLVIHSMSQPAISIIEVQP